LPQFVQTATTHKHRYHRRDDISRIGQLNTDDNNRRVGSRINNDQQTENRMRAYSGLNETPK